MSSDNAAMLYILDLGPDRVTRTQKQVLLRIADHWSHRYEMAHLPTADLCDELLMSSRQLRRVLKQLVSIDLLRYTPGIGAGNWGKFRFPGMPAKEATMRTERGQNGDKTDTAIRKDLNLKQDLQSSPISPPAEGTRSLTPREVARIVKELGAYYERRRREWVEVDEHELLIEAKAYVAQRLLIPFELISSHIESIATSIESGAATELQKKRARREEIA